MAFFIARGLRVNVEGLRIVSLAVSSLIYPLGVKFVRRGIPTLVGVLEVSSRADVRIADDKHTVVWRHIYRVEDWDARRDGVGSVKGCVRWMLG